MSEARYRIAFFRGWNGHRLVDKSYSWNEVLALVRRNREDGLNLRDIIVLSEREAEMIPANSSWRKPNGVR